MKFGAAVPITALSDPTAVRDFAQALDEVGFDLLSTSGHILGVPADRYTDRPPATYAGPFHDPFVLFGYLAALTNRLHFRPSILIMPLYPTALAAKQAAELQFVSCGRFELGVGISWNAAEYEALGQDFASRGKRLDEQLVVLRLLWTEPYVTFNGRWHHFDGVGLGRATTTPIPIWVGGSHERALRRAASYGDGFIPLGDPSQAMPVLRNYVVEAGRDASAFGLTGRVVAGPGGPVAWIESARALQALGATHLNLSTPPDVPATETLPRLIAARRVLADELGS
jgi:probable F420-dependent oxidoreductase